MLFILAILIFIILYCSVALILKTPTFKTSSHTAKLFKDSKKGNVVMNAISSITNTIAPYIPLSEIQENSIKKALNSAAIAATPKQYIAVAFVYGGAFALLAIPCFFINPTLALLPLGAGIYMFLLKKNEAFKEGNKRRYAIEKELPRFTSYVANSTKSNRNIIEIISVYKQNYTSELCKELSIVVGDMKTGNQEKALQRMETRVNSTMLSEVVRGLLSFMRGDNMVTYFESLNLKLTSLWQQRLKGQALAKEPKISMLSYLLTGAAMVSIFYVMITLMFKIL